jgi:segregation and condensation protein A
VPDLEQEHEQDHRQSGEFPVELPIFNGPFRLLAELIHDGKVDVCDVPVATVTERFLARADEAEGWSLEEVTWFLAVCAALLQLKVGRLFPSDKDPEEEELLGGSPDLVFARGLELTAFRKVAKSFAEQVERSARSIPREAGPAEEFAHLYPDLLEKVSAEDLAESARELFRPAVVDLHHVTPIRATVGEAVDVLERRLTRRHETRFRDLVKGCQRIQVVVRFLALLELHAQGRVALQQAETFGDIEVRWEG